MATLEPGLVAGEPQEVALGPERPFDAGRAHLELVGVGDEVDDVERGAQVTRDVRAELEVDRRLARRQRLSCGAGLLDEHAEHPAAALGPEFDVDHLGPVRVHDRLENAQERGAIDHRALGRGNVVRHR